MPIPISSAVVGPSTISSKYSPRPVPSRRHGVPVSPM
ncbi:hypothetical protein KB681_gp58 [Burkholderia phage Mica]|uniref:Uncharacterized protein n=1 Tax=Burkholderia phage Mica TaxID=2767579 RepID=A0A873WTT9_9CAUD|nr:hypothetical protein KB681_gp58 [Burkholderia phage Mica]QPB08654.1 hypothetical protein CPT_Mica_042 [Burkholderia phage Mica]